MLIDSYAYTNRMHFVHPVIKIIFSLITMLMCFFFNVYGNFAVILFMFFIIVFKAGIPTKTYVKFLFLPFSFLILGLITIMITPLNNNINYVFAVEIFGMKMGVSYSGTAMALKLFFRALAVVSCLYFLIFTTPIVDIINILSKIRIPAIFIELFQLVYRFIFVLLKEVEEIYISQDARLGYKNIKNAFRSSGLLVYSLFTKSYRYSQDLYIALESRLYTGDINVLSNEQKFSFSNIFFFIIIDLMLITITIFTRRWLQ
ncbi:MAG: cobalt ECF transporter T component CbiQ [Minisyncoccia bacterium]